MPTPRVPTAILEAKGSFGVHPERRAERANEPEPSGELGSPPKSLSKQEKAIWREFADEIPPGVAKNSDRKVVAMACRLEHKARIGSAKTADLTLLHKCLVSMGMTPADRSRVSVAKKEKSLREMLEAPAASWDSTEEKPN